MKRSGRILRLVLILVVLSAVNLAPRKAKAEPMKEFIMACSYGVLAGTLVGAASLAFTKQPGENLRNIARGASLGLYLGIGLGLYVVYVVPNKALENDNFEAPVEGVQLQKSFKPPKFALIPEFSETGISGLSAQYQIHSF